MIHSRGANASTAELVWTQILQGAGGFSAAAMQVGAQASVTHADVAMVTAVVLLVTEIGGAIGSAVGTFFLVLYWFIILMHIVKPGLFGQVLCLIISLKICHNYLQSSGLSYLEVLPTCSRILEEIQCAKA